MRQRNILMILLLLLLFSGCSSSIQRNIVAPSENNYYTGNKYYGMKDYEAAIDYYKKYLALKPSGSLSIPAKINLGMSYYYLGKYDEAHNTLKNLKIDDENIMAYIKKICQKCEDINSKNSSGIDQNGLPVKKGHIRISITDAYLDDSEDLVIQGKLDQQAELTVSGTPVPLKKGNTFKATVRWRKGQSVLIRAEQGNNVGELRFFPDGEPPDKPEGLRPVNVSANSIEIEWDENSEPDVKGYKLYYRLQGGSWDEVPDLIRGTSYEVVGLANRVRGANKTFEFYLRAIDRMNNESDPSDVLQVALP